MKHSCMNKNIISKSKDKWQTGRELLLCTSQIKTQNPNRWRMFKNGGEMTKNSTENGPNTDKLQEIHIKMVLRHEKIFNFTQNKKKI